MAVGRVSLPGLVEDLQVESFTPGIHVEEVVAEDAAGVRDRTVRVEGEKQHYIVNYGVADSLEKSRVHDVPERCKEFFFVLEESL